MIDKVLDEKILGWIEENKSRILEQWMALAKVPSVQSPAQPKAPFGPECARALKLAASFFEEKGIPVRINEDSGYALADFGEGEKTIGLFGHSDVVPAGDGWVMTEPFQPIIRDGALIGRGVSDNKSGVMASLCILTMAKELDLPLRSRLRAFIGSNEESGMRDIVAFKAQETLPDVSFIPDGSFPCSLGEKGILRMWVKSNAPLQSVKSMVGGNAFNIVLDHVDTVLTPNPDLARELAEACEKESGCAVTVAENGDILLSAEGVAKHAGSPDGSLNATWVALKLLNTCPSLPDSDRKILQVAEQYLSCHWGEGMGIAHTDENFGKLTAANGMVDMEDGCLKLAFDIRYGTSLSPVALEEQLYTLWENSGWEIIFMENRAGYSVDPASPMPETIKGIFTELSGIDLPLYRMSGGTYGRYLPNAYCVGTSVGRPAVALPAGHGGAHQRDEAIDIEGFFLALRILMHCILACDAILSE